MEKRALFCFGLLAACGTVHVPETEALAPNKDQIASDSAAGKGDWSVDWCESQSWYGDGECDWFCPKRDNDCNGAPLFANPAGSAARYPIVLIHGFDGSPNTRFALNDALVSALQADGHQVFATVIPPYDGLEVRNRVLIPELERILRDTGAGKLNLIAHSMGGLNARDLISNQGFGNRVASLTTISTPHRGTAIADVALELVPGFADKALNALYSNLGGEAAEDSHVRAALTDLAEANLLAAADDSRVYYQSWAGISTTTGRRHSETDAVCEGKVFINEGTFDRLNLSLIPMAVFVGHGTALVPNDGLVSVASSKWGDFRGCIPADHLREVGRGSDDGSNTNTGFDAVRFYRTVAFDLAAKGF